MVIILVFQSYLVQVCILKKLFWIKLVSKILSWEIIQWLKYMDWNVNQNDKWLIIYKRNFRKVILFLIYYRL